jgi:hypothetical protein
VTQYGTHPIASRFKGQTLFSIVSSVTKGDKLPPNAELVELAFSNEGSWAETDLDLLFGETPSAGYEPKKDLKGPVSIAAALRVTGEKESRVVVFGDADFVTNQYFRQVYNKDLFLNSVSWAIGESAGITIRPKTYRESSARITNAQANVMFLITAILIPEVLLLIGLAVWWTRRV